MPLRVNGIEIDEAAVQYELDRLVKFYSEYMSAQEILAQKSLLRKKACEQAIGARLLIGETERLQIRVPAEDLDERLRQVVENAGGAKAFSALLKKQGLTREQLVASLAQGLRVNLLVDKIAADVKEPTTEDIQAHFDAHRREYRRSDRARAQHILIVPDSKSPQDRETARSRLQEIRQRIVEGAKFADEAAAHSQCPSGKKTGGSLGWFSRGMMVPEFDKAVFSMSVGELSEVVETPLGLHLIQKTGDEKGGNVELKDVQDKVRDFLRHARRGEVIAAYVNELKKNAIIEED